VKLNLGCGRDVKQGYVNVDINDGPGITKVDLSKFPWPWADGCASEVLMYDFLEHFPYVDTKVILRELRRILSSSGKAEIQVPDFEQCALAMLGDYGFLCNSCGNYITLGKGDCDQCGQKFHAIAEAAMNRLYGGQNYVGNWHFTAFTETTLRKKLKDAGFMVLEMLEKDHQRKNWNMKFLVKKDPYWDIDWGDADE
jgi:hypothetical protein